MPAPYSERIDAIKYAAAFAVVGIHCIGWVQENGLSNPHEPIFSWAHATLRWSVPVFVMVSGALLLSSERDETLTSFLFRRLGWLTPIILFWTCIYSLLRLITNSDHSIGSQFIASLTGRPFLHLWYLYILPGLYLFTIPLRVYLRGASCRDQWLLFSGLALLLWLNIGLSMLLAPGTLSPWPFWFVGYLPYFLLGLLISDIRSNVLGLCLYGVGIILTGVLTSAGSEGSVFMDYGSPTVYLTSAGAFILLMSLPGHALKLVPIAKRKSFFSMSLGVYLVHPAFLSAIKRAPLDLSHFNPFLLIMVLWLGVFAASSATVYLLQRTPVMHRFV